ncbi:cyclic nucleotide-binding domain protein [Leptospira ryugenii]|uniref:Cyclic nucleotide-binding domain protein n=1 Tax=Leptospira ryugenii TaxID=1917863 RepID=A0A2P2DXX0_9LEPT|nr:cyclic nucleotide-binding domain-containing protein [Leptospira ryugenii]GBF49485.1 cyclic nucleotide-binding domain protein [Leptospira ryugenii]
MSAESLKKYISAVKVQHFPKDTKVFSEGEESNGVMYFVFSGKLMVTKRSGMGDDLILRQIGPGEFFGELALIQHSPRAANVIAISEDTKVGMITKDIFLAMGHESPGFLSMLLNSVIRRLTEVEDKVVERRQELHELINAGKIPPQAVSGSIPGTEAVEAESPSEQQSSEDQELPIPIDPSLMADETKKS